MNTNATRRDQQAEGKAVNAFGGNFLLAKTFVLALLRFLVAASRYTAAEIRVLCLVPACVFCVASTMNRKTPRLVSFFSRAYKRWLKSYFQRACARKRETSPR